MCRWKGMKLSYLNSYTADVGTIRARLFDIRLRQGDSVFLVLRGDGSFVIRPRQVFSLCVVRHKAISTDFLACHPQKDLA